MYVCMYVCISKVFIQRGYVGRKGGHRGHFSAKGGGDTLDTFNYRPKKVVDHFRLVGFRGRDTLGTFQQRGILFSNGRGGHLDTLLNKNLAGWYVPMRICGCG